MSDFIISPAAQRDLDIIWEYIAEDTIDAADRWLSKLEDAIQLIARSPGVGHTRTDLTSKTVLFWPVGRYLIVYRDKSRPVEIVRVLNAYRDISRVL